MKKKNQDTGLTLKKLYKVIRVHSEDLKLSKRSAEKVETYKQEEKFLKTLGDLVYTLQKNPKFERRLVRIFSRVNL